MELEFIYTKLFARNRSFAIFHYLGVDAINGQKRGKKCNTNNSVATAHIFREANTYTHSHTMREFPKNGEWEMLKHRIITKRMKNQTKPLDKTSQPLNSFGTKMTFNNRIHLKCIEFFGRRTETKKSIENENSSKWQINELTISFVRQLRKIFAIIITERAHTQANRAEFHHTFKMNARIFFFLEEYLCVIYCHVNDMFHGF